MKKALKIIHITILVILFLFIPFCMYRIHVIHQETAEIDKAILFEQKMTVKVQNAKTKNELDSLWAIVLDYRKQHDIK